MARWTDAYQLREVALRRQELLSSGVYELGFVRGGVFHPVYVGKAKVLYNRLRSYVTDRCHNDLVTLQRETGHYLIWYHTFRTADYANTEARLQQRFGVREEGLYRWNKKLESLKANDDLM